MSQCCPGPFISMWQMPNERAGAQTVRGGGGTDRRKERGGGEVLEAEFALSPISTFGLQMFSPLSSITRLVCGSEWLCVCISVCTCLCVCVCVCVWWNKGKAALMLPHLESLIKRGRLQNQSKLGSSVWALSRNQGARTGRMGEGGGDRERRRRTGDEINLNLHYFTFTLLCNVSFPERKQSSPMIMMISFIFGFLTCNWNLLECDWLEAVAPTRV